jgi:hypothetical protein
VIDRSLMLVRHHLEIAGIQLRQQRLEGDPQIIADRTDQQALVALLVNAVEAIKEAGDRDGRAVRRRDGDADWCGFHITDSGVGIPPEVLPGSSALLFHQDKKVASALGLAVVYGIVQRHRGDIAWTRRRAVARRSTCGCRGGRRRFPGRSSHDCASRSHSRRRRRVLRARFAGAYETAAIVVAFVLRVYQTHAVPFSLSIQSSINDK